MAEFYSVQTGGLMRCCLVSLDDEMLRREAANVPLCVNGQKFLCEYCRAIMVCENGQWRWEGPKEP